MTPMMTVVLPVLFAFAAADQAPDVSAIVAAAPRPAHLYRPADGPPPPQRPQRIVSLAPVATEVLFSVGAGDRLVGVTRFCDRPAAALALPRVGGYVDPSAEKILLLRPDLVVAMPSFSQRATLDRLRDAGVPVLVLFADTLAEVRALPAALGSAVGAAALGDVVGARLDAQLATLRADGAVAAARLGRRTRVLVVVGVDPIVVAGPGTFADDMVRLIGAEPVPAPGTPAWPQWSPEAVLVSKPDVVVVAEGAAPHARLARLLKAGRFAVRHADRPILMRPGPSLADDARALLELVHPSADERAP